VHAIIKIEYLNRVPFGAAVDGSAVMCMVEFNERNLRRKNGSMFMHTQAPQRVFRGSNSLDAPVHTDIPKLDFATSTSAN
jgi:hypothetical protein